MSSHEIFITIIISFILAIGFYSAAASISREIERNSLNQTLANYSEYSFSYNQTKSETIKKSSQATSLSIYAYFCILLSVSLIYLTFCRNLISPIYDDFFKKLFVGFAFSMIIFFVISNVLLKNEYWSNIFMGHYETVKFKLFPIPGGGSILNVFLAIIITLVILIFSWIISKRNKEEVLTSVKKEENDKKRKNKIMGLFSKEKIFMLTFCFLIIVLLIIAVFYLKTPAESKDYTEIKKTYDIISGFFTFLVSIIYALFTYLTINEMKITRKQQNTPNLVVRLEPLGVSHTVLRIKNVGGGPAFNINLKYSIMKDNKIIKESIWTHSLLQPTEFVRLVIDEKGIKEFYQEYDIADFDISCNSEQNIIENKIKLDLKELLKGLTNVSWIWETTAEEDIHSISERLKEIKGLFEDISKNLKYLSYESKEKYDKKTTEEIKRIIESRKKESNNNQKNS